MNSFWSKVTGGRYVIVIMDTFIYPSCVVLCGVLAVLGKLQTETFIAVLGAYALLVKETRQSYFNRMDRKPENGGNGTSVPPEGGTK